MLVPRQFIWYKTVSEKGFVGWPGETTVGIYKKKQTGMGELCLIVVWIKNYVVSTGI